jgi:hypothetical protein
MFGASRCWTAQHPFCTASSGTTTPTSAMLTSTGLNAAGYVLYFNSWIKLLIKLAKFPKIQKRDRPFTSTGFASMLKPNVFDGSNYKRWLLTVNFRQSSHEFTFNVGIDLLF